VNAGAFWACRTGVDPIAPRRGAMGISCSREDAKLAHEQLRQKLGGTKKLLVPVTLNVYNVGTSSLPMMINSVLKPLGTGAFHCGVELMGSEWSFTDISGPRKAELSGVFPCAPKTCPGHTFTDTVPMGNAYLSEADLHNLVLVLEQEWPAVVYDTLHNNCCHFANEFCQRLGVGSIPPWVMHLAGAGVSVSDATDFTCCRTMSAQVKRDVTVGVCCADGGHQCEVESVDMVPALEAHASRQDGLFAASANSSRPL